MKIKTPVSISNVDSWEDLRRYASITLDAVLDLLNGKIGLVDNCQTSLVSASFSATGQTVTVAHTLRRIPNGYIVVGRSANITIFDGSGSNDGSNIYIQASGAGSAMLLVF